MHADEQHGGDRGGAHGRALPSRGRGGTAVGPATAGSPGRAPLVLIEGEPDADTRLDHLGVEVGTSEEVGAAAERLARVGLATRQETDTTCCYAVQDKVWVQGPGKEPWEVYVVKADAGLPAGAADAPDDGCACTTC
ncbi:glyoxalase/bleomycin resistance/dioxygenase family protein [Streptomyces sp. NPDC055893]